jgi:hypothetical protein
MFKKTVFLMVGFTFFQIRAAEQETLTATGLQEQLSRLVTASNGKMTDGIFGSYHQEKNKIPYIEATFKDRHKVVLGCFCLGKVERKEPYLEVLNEQFEKYDKVHEYSGSQEVRMNRTQEIEEYHIDDSDADLPYKKKIIGQLKELLTGLSAK